MSENTENHTIKLLQEMRKEIGERFNDIEERFDDVNLRIDGVAHIMTLMAGNMGGHENRIEELEAAVEDLNKS